MKKCLCLLSVLVSIHCISNEIIESRPVDKLLGIWELSDTVRIDTLYIDTFCHVDSIFFKQNHILVVNNFFSFSEEGYLFKENLHYYHDTTYSFILNGHQIPVAQFKWSEVEERSGLLVDTNFQMTRYT